MIWLRSLLFNIVMYVGTLLCSLWGQGLRFLAPQKLPALAKFWARFLLNALRLICGVRLEVEGWENLAGGGLIAAQHQSALDIMVWLHLLPKPAYVLKQELLKIPLFGSLLIPSGLIAVDRQGGMAAMRGMVAQCQAAIADGRQIVIFPEGTRVAPGQRVALAPGVVALAKALGMPVIPAATNSGRCWGRNAFRKTPGAVHVKVFAPLPPTLRREDMLAALAARFYDEEPLTTDTKSCGY